VRPLRVGLTGGIATGKSYVRQQLAARGVPTLDADALAREAVAPGSPGLAAVAARFGPGVIAADGSLDRGRLGRIVFADPRARADLEAIVHPRVYQAITAWYAALPAATPFAVADVPLLYETGHAAEFDRVIVTACDPATQIARVMARDALSAEDARRRLAAQWPIADKAARANYVIRTDGSYEETDRQVAGVLRALERDRA
jgi:dephospho-CoA kinase